MVKTPSKNFSRVLQNFGLTPNNKEEPNIPRITIQNSSENTQQLNETKQQETTFDADTMAIVNKYLNLAPVTTAPSTISSCNFNYSTNQFNYLNSINDTNSITSNQQAVTNSIDTNHEPELVRLNLEQTKQEISTVRAGATNPVGEMLEKQILKEVKFFLELLTAIKNSDSQIVYIPSEYAKSVFSQTTSSSPYKK